MINTLGEVRAAIATSLTDDSLRDLMEAAEADILAVAGPIDFVSEYIGGGHRALVLAHEPESISSITEDVDGTATVLAADDFRVEGYILHRLTTGTNPSSWWRGLVLVAMARSDDWPLRKRAQVALIRLDLQTASGVSAERMGDYSVSYGSQRGPTYSDQRVAILSSLTPVMVR